MTHYPLVEARSQLASKLQSTLVRPDVTRAQLIEHIECCGEYGFNAAMIPMAYVPLARSILSGTNVKIATTICFGTGNESINAKVALLRECSALGAHEVDYEPHMTLFLSGEYDAFREESATLINAAGAMTLKAMLELSFIEPIGEKKHAALLLEEAGVPWVKNASGGGPRPGQATPEAIRLLRETLHSKTKVKASGGIKTYPQAMALLDAGAELLGTSAAVAIIQGTEAKETNY
jgi:deoxyribose-phosphate aldolase